MNYMERHDGNILGYVLRKNGFSITELAAAANVNRRTIYNLFQQRILKWIFIHGVGRTIKHDFSIEFPEHFTRYDFTFEALDTQATNILDDPLINDSNDWKEKYISLLEAYILFLLN
ncbi:hypothetical protein A0256_13965 [Mucilaginibacter sp. PAMC 26640]|nr:hypothetical protein A0256_13965 [Mucilaginibacter sp. PAMC 26640]